MSDVRCQVSGLRSRSRKTRQPRILDRFTEESKDFFDDSANLVLHSWGLAHLEAIYHPTHASGREGTKADDGHPGSHRKNIVTVRHVALSVEPSDTEDRPHGIYIIS